MACLVCSESCRHGTPVQCAFAPAVFSQGLGCMPPSSILVRARPLPPKLLSCGAEQAACRPCGHWWWLPKAAAGIPPTCAFRLLWLGHRRRRLGPGHRGNHRGRLDALHLLLHVLGLLVVGRNDGAGAGVAAGERGGAGVAGLRPAGGGGGVTRHGWRGGVRGRAGNRVGA